MFFTSATSLKHRVNVMKPLPLVYGLFLTMYCSLQCPAEKCQEDRSPIPGTKARKKAVNSFLSLYEHITHHTIVSRLHSS